MLSYFSVVTVTLAVKSLLILSAIFILGKLTSSVINFKIMNNFFLYDHFQFERLGYFVCVPDSKCDIKFFKNYYIEYYPFLR